MLIHAKKKALVLRLREPGRVTTLIPMAKTIDYKGQQFIAVPHTIDAVKVLRNIGVKAPAPISHYYTWPGRYKPFAAQESTAAFLTMHNRAFCLSEIGTGKTMGVLWAYDYMRSIDKYNKVLVVSPLSTLTRTWADELFHNFPHLNYAVLHGTRDKRLKLLKQDADVYIINHDGVEVIADALKDRPDIDLVVVDEVSQVARNAKTDRWKALDTVINKQGNRAAWGLTGTPIPNEPTDAWAQCRLIVPEAVPKYVSRFRDTVMRQVGPYKWVARDNALDVVRDAMQPSIRFTRDECVDLPPCMYETRDVELSPEQKRAYKSMLDSLHTEVGDSQITAVNEAVKLSKLVQIACIAEGTLVLTRRGWVPIQHVDALDIVWDGMEWVTQGGSVYRGMRYTTVCHGVRMTRDHEVLTTHGWKTAQEVLHGNAGKGFDRADVRLPDGYREERINIWSDEMRNLAVPLLVWERGCSKESVPAEQVSHHPSKLRLPSRQRDSQDVEHATVQCVDTDAAKVLEPVGQELGKLRRAWHYGLRALENLVRKLHDGHGCDIPRGFDARSAGQQRAVFGGQLRMGNPSATVQQQTVQRDSGYPERAYDDGAGSASVRSETRNPACQGEPVRMGHHDSIDYTRHVYDLIKCGPRQRFVVRGSDGQRLIVHNCGVAYGNTGEEVSIPAQGRLSVVHEIVEAAGAKVIVFVPFVSAVAKVTEYLLSKGITAEMIHGGVSKTERDRILKSFQQSKDPRVLVAQPATLSHGLTLTEANTIVWYAPITSNDVATQAEGRITRPGQKNHQFIIQLAGTPLELKMYDRLKNKQGVQGLLLEMMKDEGRN